MTNIRLKDKGDIGRNLNDNDLIFVTKTIEDTDNSSTFGRIKNQIVSQTTGLTETFYSKTGHTHSVSDVNNLNDLLNTKANLSGATFTGNILMSSLSASSLSASSINGDVIFDQVYLTYNGTSGTTSGTKGCTLTSPGNWTISQFSTVYFIDDKDGNITVTIPDSNATNLGKTLHVIKPRLVQSDNEILIKTVSSQAIAETSTFYLKSPNDRAELISVPFVINGATGYKYRINMIERSIHNSIQVSTDNTQLFSTIKSAVDYANNYFSFNSPITIIVEPGYYIIDEPILLTKENINIQGKSVSNTFFIQSDNIVNSSMITSTQNFEISNITFIGNYTTSITGATNFAVNSSGFTSDKALSYGYPSNLIYNTTSYCQWSTDIVEYPINITYYDGNSYTAQSYKMKAVSTSGSRMPKSWTLYGKLGAGAFTLLDTQTEILWSASEEKIFEITSPGEYDTYEFRITSSDNSTRLTIDDIGLWNNSGLTQSNAYSAILCSGLTYCEIQNVVIDGFQKGICFNISDTEIWLFNSIIKNCTLAGVCNLGGASIGCSEVTFENNKYGINFFTGDTQRHSIQNTIFIVNSGQTGINWNTTGNTYEYAAITNNIFHGEGTKISGFTWDSSADADIRLENNVGLDNYSPQAFIEFVNNTQLTNCTSLLNYYKVSGTNTSDSFGVKFLLENNKAIYLSSISKNLRFLVTGSIECDDNSTEDLLVALFKNGNTLITEQDIRIQEQDRPYPFSLNKQIKVNKDDYFELWIKCTTTINREFRVSYLSFSIF